MRGVMLFVAGLFAGLAIQVVMAQNSNSGVVMMNHVGINVPNVPEVGSSRVDLQACKLEYSIVSPK